jgi:hypothetical protein
VELQPHGLSFWTQGTCYFRTENNYEEISCAKKVEKVINVMKVENLKNGKNLVKNGETDPV